MKYFVMEVESNLKDISILDTPGFDSVNLQDIEMTSEAIIEADYIMWIIKILKMES